MKKPNQTQDAQSKLAVDNDVHPSGDRMAKSIRVLPRSDVPHKRKTRLILAANDDGVRTVREPAYRAWFGSTMDCGGKIMRHPSLDSYDFGNDN